MEFHVSSFLPEITYLGQIFRVLGVNRGQISIFRVDALALSVIATATWLAGWVSVTAGIVSKRLNLSENFLHHLVAPSFMHLGPLTPIPNSKGNPFLGGVKYRGGKIGDFRSIFNVAYIAVYLGNGAR